MHLYDRKKSLLMTRTTTKLLSQQTASATSSLVLGGVCRSANTALLYVLVLGGTTSCAPR